ncbi:hypothetical protein [Sphaerisporangium album]|nr:hypothetical protein [Sphaerisporangium album]
MTATVSAFDESDRETAKELRITLLSQDGRPTLVQAARPARP